MKHYKAQLLSLHAMPSAVTRYAFWDSTNGPHDDPDDYSEWTAITQWARRFNNKERTTSGRLWDPDTELSWTTVGTRGDTSLRAEYNYCWAIVEYAEPETNEWGECAP